jgi:F-type H+-transporting ATPase subunit delta
MKATPKKYAQALYELAEGKNETEIKEIVGRFIAKLARDGKLNKAEAIVREFRNVWNERNDTVEAQIMSSTAISKETEKKLSGYISELTGAGKILLEKKIDKDILGGVVIRYGSTVMDGSLKKGLEDLKYRMIR